MTAECLFNKNERSVHKFGGTSMANFQAMSRSADVVMQIKGPVVIVVSAAATITRSLMHLSHPSTPLAEQERLLAHVEQVHTAMLAELKHPDAIRADVEALLAEVKQLNALLQQQRTLKGVDALLSIGERLSSLVFSQVLVDCGLNAVWFDAREVMKTSDHFGEAEPLLPEIKAAVEAKLLPLCEQKVVVTQGYIGSTLAGQTTTLGKESSDYSAALLAEALGAHHFAIWTDIPGVFTTDPKITQRARPIKVMSMQNALALTEAGAKVLHPRTMLPALRTGMSFFVGSSQGLAGGTWVEQSDEGRQRTEVVAINLRLNQILLSFDHTAVVPTQAGIQTEILSCLAAADIKPAFFYSDHLATEMLLDDSLREFRRESILRPNLSHQLHTLTPMSIEENLQLIAIIGNRLDQHAPLRQILADFINRYKIRVLSFGMSTHALFILVHENEVVAKEMVMQLHHELFERTK